MHYILQYLERDTPFSCRLARAKHVGREERTVGDWVIDVVIAENVSVRLCEFALRPEQLTASSFVSSTNQRSNFSTSSLASQYVRWLQMMPPLYPALILTSQSSGMGLKDSCPLPTDRKVSADAHDVVRPAQPARGFPLIGSAAMPQVLVWHLRQLQGPGPRPGPMT